MAYKILWDVRAYRELKHLDVTIAVSILNTLNKLYEDPRKIGKPLKGKFKQKFRLRVGDYRVLYSINDQDKTVLIIAIGHRKDIYD